MGDHILYFKVKDVVVFGGAKDDRFTLLWYGYRGGSLRPVRAGGEGRRRARLRLVLITMVKSVSSCDAKLTSPSAVVKLVVAIPGPCTGWWACISVFYGRRSSTKCLRRRYSSSAL